MAVRIIKEDGPERSRTSRVVSESLRLVEETVRDVRSELRRPAGGSKLADHAEILGIALDERIGHKQREHVTRFLERSVEDGYLPVEEAADRITLVQDALIGEDAVALVADLPLGFMGEVQEAVVRSERAALARKDTPKEILWFLAANVSVWIAWFVTGHDTGSLWPLWVLLGTGFFLVSHLRKAAGARDGLDD